MNYTLSIFNTGQITIPKKVREGLFANVKKLVAEETAEGFLIKPLLTNKSKVVVMPYQNDQEEGIIFPEGIDASDLINLLKESDE